VTLCECGGRLVQPATSRFAVKRRTWVCVRCGSVVGPRAEPWRSEKNREQGCSCRPKPRVVYMVPVGYYCAACRGHLTEARLRILDRLSARRGGAK
jgi:hypothetical protein